MEIKFKPCIIWVCVAFTAYLSCIDLYSQDTLQKPSRQSAVDAFSKGDYENALREFNNLLQIYSKDPLYKYYSGVCLVKMKRDPEDASAFLQEAIDGSLEIKSIPDDAWFYLGRAQQMMGRFPEAITSFNYFEKKAGRKKAREFDVSIYIQECTEGRGLLAVSAYQTGTNVSKTTNDVIPEDMKNATENFNNQPIVKTLPQKTELPHEYDIVLSEAMKYQVKADSLNALVSESRKELDKLPSSQRQAEKIRISEMESLAVEYQRIADEKFGNTNTKTLVEKEVVVPPAVPDAKKSKEIYSLFNVETNPVIVSEKRIEIDPELPAGLIYRIQIGVFSKPVDPSFFKGISPVAGFKVSGTGATKYFAGMFRMMADANRALLTVKQMGFKDAFITAVSDGKAVSIDRASILENEWSQKPLLIIAQSEKTGENVPSTLIFRVEIARSVKPVSNEVTDAYKKMAGNRGFEIILTEYGTHIYLIGKFITFESASEYADLLKRNGYRESMVVAYLGSKEIPVETAKQLFEKQK
jgi:hypothetical protein